MEYKSEDCLKCEAFFEIQSYQGGAIYTCRGQSTSDKFCEEQKKRTKKFDFPIPKS